VGKHKQIGERRTYIEVVNFEEFK
jgi:hypothetical protein